MTPPTSPDASDAPAPGSVTAPVSRAIGRLRLRYAVGLACLLLTNILFLSIPWVIRAAIKSLEAGEPRGALIAAAVVAAVAVVGAVVRTVSRTTVLGAGRFVERDYRRRIFEHLARMPPSYYARNRVGDLMSRATNDLMLVRALMGPGILYAANTVFVYAVALAGLSTLDPILAVATFAPLPPLTLFVMFIAHRVRRTTRAAQDALGALSSGVQETLAGIGVVHAFNLERREAERFSDRSRDYLRLNVAEARWRGAIAPLVSLSGGTATLLVILIGGQAVADGRLTIADLAAFVATLGLLVMPTVTLGWVISLAQRGLAAIARIREVLDEVPSIRDRESVRTDPIDLGRTVSIGDLEIVYPGSERRRPALTGIGFDVAPGRAIGVSGPTGSGKTTLLRALCRLVELPDGAIHVGDVDLNDVPLALWRSEVGYVPQDGFLFSASLAENVRFGRPTATDAEVRDAVAAASLDVDLDALPHGLETLVGPRGVRLSGGQRQRLALARALLLRPRLLVLDDSLSNVDTETAARIMRRLQARADADGTTVVIAAHRTATLAFCDEVIVLDRGEQVERGTPADLAARTGGVFAALAAREREDAAFARLAAETEASEGAPASVGSSRDRAEVER